MREATGYIRNYGYQSASTWFDNDKAGEQAMQMLSEYLVSEKIEHYAMNPYYAPYKDVNEYHTVMLNLLETCFRHNPGK